MPSRPEPVSSAEIDDVTLARAQRGDGAAFAVIVHRYEGLLWAYLWRMMGAAATRVAVEDLFQETFLGVHRGLGRFSPGGPARLSTWILAVGTRVALHRRRKWRREAPATSAEVEGGDGGAQAHGIERRMVVAKLVAALDELSPDHRAVFVLRQFHELEYEDIARVLELEVGTVRSRLHRARESLRRAFEEKP
jgi:RNA polymerase sigma-70 factor (ECF subfamily)